MNTPAALNPTHVPAPVFTLGYTIAHIESYKTQAGLRAFGYPRALMLKALHRNEFRHLQC